MKSTLTRDLNFIREAGFSHIKVELEGSLGRGNGKCVDCAGNGKRVCGNCEGKGVIGEPASERFPESTLVECSACKGDAVSSCTSCEGRGTNHRFSRPETCFKWLMAEICQELTGETIDKRREAIKPSARTSSHAGYYITDHKLIPGLAYAEFYNDGSVDSELTFTVDLEHAKELPVYIKAFEKLGVVGGRGHIDVQGAGMHISVIPTEANGNYPTGVGLDTTKLSNFTENMNKLLPALFFVAASGAKTRGFNYRSPRISNSDKYSAIFTHRGTCFEYRVFDTCYQRPEAIFEFIGVIAQSLKFYHDPSLKVKELKQTFDFKNDRTVVGFFNNPGNLRILNAQIKYLKPSSTSFKELKRTRGVHITIAALAKEKKANLAKLRQNYEKYKKEYQHTYQRPLTSYEATERDYYMIEENVGVNTAEEIVRSRRIGAMLSFSQYLDNNLRRKDSGLKVAV